MIVACGGSAPRPGDEAELSSDAGPEAEPGSPGDAGADGSAGDSAADDGAADDGAPTDAWTGADGGETAPDPWAEGPLGVTESTVQVEVGGRSPVRVALYVPNDVAGAPYPVVIYSHGFQLNGGQYASTARHLASHGLVTLLPSYGDSLLSPRSHLALANDLIALIDRVEQEASDESSALFGVIDPSALGVAGHSRGGKQSTLAAILDGRPTALFGVDAVDSLPPGQAESEDWPSVTPEMMPALAIPSAWIGAGRASSGTMGACAPEGESYHQYFIAAPSPAFEYLLPEAGHLDFPDGCGLLCLTCVGGAEPAWSRAFARATMVAFFRVYLAGDDRYLPWVSGEPVTSLSDRVAFGRR